MFWNFNSHFRYTALVWLALLGATGCGARSVDTRGGESHFLWACDETCSDGMDCIRGACTQTCKSDRECTTLHTSATCVGSDADTAHCDVECETIAACDGLGGNFECSDGICRIQGSQHQSVAIQDAAPGPNGPQSDAATTLEPSNSSQAPLSTSELDAGSVTSLPITSSSDASDGAAPRSCRYAHVWYESGEEVPAGLCTTCLCEDGEVVCKPTPKLPCSGLPILECPEEPVPSDDVTVDLSYIEEYTLTLVMSYGGGCQTHDFSVCFEPSFLESDPVQMRLRLTHDAHDDACLAIGSTTQRFDLHGIAAMYEDTYETLSGIVGTNFGTLAFGTLSCEERRTAPRFQLQHIVEQLDLTCQSDDDCELYPTKTDCFEACDTVVSMLDNQSIGEPDSSSSKDLLAREITRVNESVCPSYAAECGEPGSGTLCTGPDGCSDTCKPGVPRCIDEQCQLNDE